MKSKNYDIVVVGGGTAGCSCAWNAARLGLKTLLIEKNSYLGGAITSQLVIPAMKTDDRNFNTNFYDELCNQAALNDAQITYIDGNKGWLNPIKLPSILDRMLIEVGVHISYNSKISDVSENIASKHSNKNTRILSLCIDTNCSDNKTINNYIDMKHSDNHEVEKLHKINSKYFIDATGNADLSVILGAKLLPFEKNQAMTLRFIMEGVDIPAFAQWLLTIDSNRNVTTTAEINGNTHLSTACTWDLGPNWALKPIFDKAVSDGILKDSDRAYFQVFSIAGEDDKIAFNCPRIIADSELSPLKKSDLELARAIGEDAANRLSTFCCKYFNGFENAKIYKIADEIGVRESRRVKGKYVLTKEDIYSAKIFKNPVAYSNYPIDVHSVKKDDYILDYVQKTYSIPLESLMVEGFENLFVIGRCLSADFYAQAAVRIQPTCFSMGEGLAKYLALL